MSKSFENANQELVLSKETSLEDLDDDAPIYLELNARETHTYNWVKKEGKRVLQEYFDCEPFELAEDEGDTLFLSNLPYIEGNLPTEEPPRALNSSKFIAETYEQSIPKLILPEEKRGSFFSLMAGLSVSYSIGFSFIMMRFGGYAFLIPFILSTIFITFPINFAQYSLGQYTNMPPIVLYSRMSPIFVGVGFFVVIIQYISSSSIRFDHRFVSMTFEMIYSLTAEQIPYHGRSMVKGSLNGYLSYCPSSHFLRENECIPHEYSNYRFGKSDREYIQDKIRSELQSDHFIRDYVTAEKPPDRIFDPAYQTSHYISAATALCLFLFFMSLLWIKPYFYRIQRVVFYGTLIACILTMVLIAFNWDRNATILVSVIGFDPLKLFKLKSWVMAALHSLIVFGTVDGTYLAIGAANQFSNRVFFDLVRAKIGGFIVLILISTLFGMLTTVGATIWMMRVEKRELTVEDFRVLIYSDSQVYEFLYVYFFQNMAHKMLMLTFMALFCLWEFSGLMLIAEGSVSTMYRFFKSAARLPQFIIRYITLVFHCTALFFVHFIVNGLRQLPYLLAPYVVLIQLATFSLINYQLFFTIVITLNRKYRTVFYTHRKKIRIYYRYVLTGFILFLIAFETFSSGIRHAKIVLSPVILLTLCQMFRYRFVSKTWKSWHPTSRFKPVLYDDFEKFKSQDRGLNGKTMIDEGDWVREKSGRSFLNEEEKEEGFDDEIYEKLRKKREHLCEPTESQKEEDELEMEYNRTMGFLSDTDIVRMIREKD